MSCGKNGQKLEILYAVERKRLLAFAEADNPQGEYACPVFGAGNTEADVLLIGEAPGAEETKSGVPFVGKAGKQLTELLKTAGLDREAIYITNAVKYRPVKRKEKTVSNRTPSRAEIDGSLPLLREEILLILPHVIVTLGNTPLRAVLELSEMDMMPIGDCHGKVQRVTVGGKRFDLIPLYHPASAIYNRSLLPVMEADAGFMGRFAESVSFAAENKYN